MDDLFSQNADNFLKNKAPLAYRMRPQTLNDFIGQKHIIGEGSLLRRAILADQITSLIFFGPPGTGKTTLAQIIANSTKSQFIRLSAVTSGIQEVREILRNAKDTIRLYRKRTVLFVDEIHRFNKSQQDAFLPAVEEGIIILIGATSENPYFEVNKALLSRSRIFRLEPLKIEDVMTLLKRALTDKEKGLGNYQINITDDALNYLSAMSEGDARNAYNALELAVLTTPPDSKGEIIIDLKVAAESIQEKVISYDKSGDDHYDVVSAFIKSMRGSDPDAAVFWLARMIEAGEQPEFIARRLVICAAEDVGLADPQALVIATAASEAVHLVGWPEARIPLAEAAIYIATAEKSNSAYLAIDAAIKDMKNQPFSGVPMHLRSNSYAGAKELGHGKGYQYAHNYPGAYVKQQYLPLELKDKKYYIANSRGKENEIISRMKRRENEQNPLDK